MTARRAAFILTIAIVFGLAACGGKNHSGPSAGSVNEYGNEDTCAYVYDVLREGGSAYVGTVVSVKVEGRDHPDMFSTYEYGHIQFRVAGTMAGPPQNEITVRFWWWVDDGGRGGEGPPLADWAGGKSAWPACPRPGEHLLLLLQSKVKAGTGYGIVAHRWEVDAEDPFVKEFDVAAQFLGAKDQPTQDNLYRQLCQSDFRTMREFALDAAFSYLGHNTEGSGYTRYGGEGYDPARQCHLALLYLKHACPRISAHERLRVTAKFATWFENPQGITDELKASFEDWYLKELSARDDMRRPEAALEGLKRIVEESGVATTLGLFRKAARVGLEERLRECARSPSEDASKLAKELLTRLDQPDEKKP